MKSTNNNHFSFAKSPPFFIPAIARNSLQNTKLYTSCCICSNKDKNFKANHNIMRNIIAFTIVVSVVTKIRILKQITTLNARPISF